jgi:hypothetical protein
MREMRCSRSILVGGYSMLRDGSMLMPSGLKMSEGDFKTIAWSELCSTFDAAIRREM